MKTLVFLGTYPPVEDGIAVFNYNLLRSVKILANTSLTCTVAAINLTDIDFYPYSSEVHYKINKNIKSDYAAAAKEINSDESVLGVIIQHEYGLFGGNYGSYLIDFMKNCKKPMYLIMHTVLPDPWYLMKEVTDKLIKMAKVVIVMTKASKELLETIYPENEDKIEVILHGIDPTNFNTLIMAKRKMNFNKNIILTTFGFLSEGKGIEYVIKALPEVIGKFPNLQYLVLGETHPFVRRREGEKYRLKLMRLVRSLHLSGKVKFYDKFFDKKDIISYVQASDLYISTTLNPNQAVSGTFSDAMGSGAAIVSTDFPQAREFINRKSGTLVPIANPEAYQNAILNLLENRKLIISMRRINFTKTRSMLWTNVAHEYLSLIDSKTLLPPLNLTYLNKMTDNFGLWQFAKGNIPDPSYGYTLDDNARALIVCNLILKKGKNSKAKRLLDIYLNFLEKAQRKNGKFVNYFDKRQKITRQNYAEVLEDSYSRAMWSLSVTLNNEDLSRKTRNKAKGIWAKAIKHADSLKFPRSRAFLIKAISLCSNKKDLLIKQADYLLKEFENNSYSHWKWFEKELTYANGVLVESLFIAYERTENPVYQKAATEALLFLIKNSFMGDVFVPISAPKKQMKRGPRKLFDQQPEETQAMVSALIAAYKSTGNEYFIKRARKCFSWYLGNNLLDLPLYNYRDGGVHDGLTKNGVNINQGAESLIAYLLARLSMDEIGW